MNESKTNSDHKPSFESFATYLTSGGNGYKYEKLTAKVAISYLNTLTKKFNFTTEEFLKLNYDEIDTFERLVKLDHETNPSFKPKTLQKILIFLGYFKSYVGTLNGIPTTKKNRAKYRIKEGYVWHSSGKRTQCHDTTYSRINPYFQKNVLLTRYINFRSNTLTFFEALNELLIIVTAFEIDGIKPEALLSLNKVQVSEILIGSLTHSMLWPNEQYTEAKPTILTFINYLYDLQSDLDSGKI